MSTKADSAPTADAVRPVNPALAVLMWIWVLVPFGYGVYQLVIKIPALFGT